MLVHVFKNLPHWTHPSWATCDLQRCSLLEPGSRLITLVYEFSDTFMLVHVFKNLPLSLCPVQSKQATENKFSVKLLFYRAPGWLSRLSVLTSAQVMISRFVGSSPALGSVLTAQSLESASASFSPSLSTPLQLLLCLSKINKCLKNFCKKLLFYEVPYWRGGEWLATGIRPKATPPTLHTTTKDSW